MIWLRMIFATALALLIVGCAGEPVADAPTPPPRKAGEVAAPVAKPQAATPTPTVEVPKVETPAPVPEAEANYTPPFPEREELFVPPRRNTNVVRTDTGGETSVELMGFVDVGGAHAVLAIDGEVTPLKIGAEKYGVQVISIDQPSVVLQRGRTRWTATLQ